MNKIEAMIGVVIVMLVATISIYGAMLQIAVHNEYLDGTVGLIWGVGIAMMGKYSYES